jgi:WD40 repeat protein
MATEHMVSISQGFAKFINLEDKRVVNNLDNIFYINCLDFSNDGRLVAIGGSHGLLKIYNTSDYTEVVGLEQFSSSFSSVSFSQNSQRIVTTNWDNTFHVRETNTLNCILPIKEDVSFLWFACFSMDGSFIASCGNHQTIQISNSETGKCERILQGHTHWVKCAAFSPIDSTLLVSCSGDFSCRLWNIVTGEVLRIFLGHTSHVRFIRFFPSGERFVTASEDRTLRLWDIESEEPINTFTGHSNYINSVDISADETQILSASDDHTVKLWDIESATVLETYQYKMHVEFACFVKPRRYRAKPAKIIRDTMDD